MMPSLDILGRDTKVGLKVESCDAGSPRRKRVTSNDTVHTVLIQARTLNDSE